MQKMFVYFWKCCSRESASLMIIGVESRCHLLIATPLRIRLQTVRRRFARRGRLGLARARWWGKCLRPRRRPVWTWRGMQSGDGLLEIRAWWVPKRRDHLEIEIGLGFNFFKLTEKYSWAASVEASGRRGVDPEALAISRSFWQDEFTFWLRSATFEEAEEAFWLWAFK